MLRLTRLKVLRFRHVVPGTELRFGKTFNILLGKNGTGKSTLLELIAAILTDDLSVFDDEALGYHLEYELVDDVERQRAVVEIAYAPSAHDDVRRERRPVRAPARGQVKIDDGETVRSWSVEGLRARPSHPSEPEVELDVGLAGEWFRYRFFEAIDQEDRVSLDLVFGAWAGRLDEALETFDGLLDGTVIWAPGAAETFSATRSGAVFGELEGGEDWGFTDSSASVTSQSSTLLREIVATLGFESAKLHLTLFESNDGRRAFNEPDFLFYRADQSIVRHDLLSFGQKRMLAFLWACAINGDTPIVADELVNGLHHDWIELVMQEKLTSKQSFLATQHPFLLDYVPVADAADAKRKFIRCTLEIGADGHELMCWRNLSDDEAERLVSAMSSGIQHVSEILRDEKLW